MSTKKLALTSIVVNYILIVFGGYVASSESGMGCGPDWPLCNGVFIPVLKGATLIEYTHRVIGAVLGISVFILFIKILRGNTSKVIRTVSKWMLGLLVIQILLGAVVVFLDTPAIVVTIHLLIAMTFLSILIYIWRRKEWEDSIRSVKPINVSGVQQIKYHYNVLIGLLVFTMGLGAYIKHQSYGLACNWLGCRDSLLPASNPEILQTLHRIFAIATAVYIVVLCFLAFSKGWESSVQMRLLFALTTVLAQIGVGIATIMTNLDISWAVIHLAIATALVMVIVEARIAIGIKAINQRSAHVENEITHIY